MSAAKLWRPLALSVLVGLGCGPVFSAHAVGAKPAAERPPTVVSVDVVVTGPQGEPVRDLRATEVHVFEDKKEQKILCFRPRERGVAQRALLGPNEFSNRSRPRVPPPTVVLLDLLNEELSTGASGGIEIGKALERLEPSERLSLYLLTRHAELYPVHSLQQAEADKAESRPPWTRGAAAVLDTAMRSVVAVRSNEFLSGNLRFDPTVQALRSLAARMAAVPGRKNLIWITHGVPIVTRDVSGEPIDLTAAVRNLAGNLVRSQTAVYTVAQSAQGVGVGFNVSADMLREVSNCTGGREYGSDNPEGAINDSIRDARGAYAVAFERGAQKRPPEYHKLQVTCDRKGTHVLARQGDVDAADMPLSEQEVLFAIDSAAGATIDCTGIGLKAQIASAGAGSSAFHVSIHIDPRDALMRPGSDGRFHSPLLLVIAGYDEEGLKELPPPEKLDVSLAEQEYQSGVRDDVEVAKDITPSSSNRKIRCIVMDRELNAVGSVSVPLPGRGQGAGR
jgi:VWFA-related protein